MLHEMMPVIYSHDGGDCAFFVGLLSAKKDDEFTHAFTTRMCFYADSSLPHKGKCLLNLYIYNLICNNFNQTIFCHHGLGAVDFK